MSDQPVRSSTRIAAIIGALLLVAGAAGLWLSSGQTRASPGTATATALASTVPASLAAPPLPEEEAPLLAVPAPARERTREEKRFARIDRNDDGRIQQSEYLAQRRRNFDKLDSNGDGRLSFEEYARAGIEKFGKADANRDGVLSPAEFATTAPKPRAPSASASRQCPPCALASSEAGSED